MSLNIIERVSEEILKASNADYDNHQFYHFEPWDVIKRTEEQLSRASDDGIDLYDSEFVKHAGSDPHPFQIGYLMSKKAIRALLAGSQVGKSIAARMEVMMMATGNIPYALRYKSGIDTGIPRLITKENIIRFGRKDSRTGEVIDRNWKAIKDEQSWNCGDIEGVGIWPTEKIAPEGNQIWIGTFMKAKDNYWWPSVADNTTNEFPAEFFNRNRGNKGTNKSEGVVYTQRNNRLVFLTYEMGHKRFEAVKAWTYVADEEMPDPDIWPQLRITRILNR